MSCTITELYSNNNFSVLGLHLSLFLDVYFAFLSFEMVVVVVVSLLEAQPACLSLETVVRQMVLLLLETQLAFLLLEVAAADHLVYLLLGGQLAYLPFVYPQVAFFSKACLRSP